MARTINEKITEAEAEIVKLQNQKKRLIQQYKEQERKDRTRRLIERGAIAESLIDGAETLTNEEFKSVLESALNAGG
jgi:hypothetical protein